MPRSRSLSPISDASELSFDEGYGLVDRGDMYGRKWDPSNEQHKYVPPTTYQSVMTTVNHAWTNLSLQTARNSIVDIADDLRPVLSEKIDLAGAKIIIAATKLSAGVAKATRDFTNSKDRKAPVPESRSGHSMVKHAESDWQPMPHAFSATNTLATPNLHAVESNAAESRIGGSLMGLEGPHSKEADEVKAPSYKSSSAHRATNKDRRMEKETGEGRKPRAQRNARRKDDGFKNQSLTSLGEKNEV